MLKSEEVARPRTRTNVSERLMAFLQRTPVHFVVITISLIWLIPSVGLFVSSFRPAAAVSRTGWWTALQTPFTFTL